MQVSAVPATPTSSKVIVLGSPTDDTQDPSTPER